MQKKFSPNPLNNCVHFNKSEIEENINNISEKISKIQYD